MGTRSQGQNGGRVLWKAIRDNRAELLQEMDSNPNFLRALARSGLVDKDDVPKLEKVKDRESRNSDVLRSVLENEADVSYSFDKFVDALNSNRQSRLAQILNADSNAVKQNRPRDVDDYLDKEQRRAQIKYPNSRYDDDDEDDAPRGKRVAPKRSRSAENGKEPADRKRPGVGTRSRDTSPEKKGASRKSGTSPRPTGDRSSKSPGKAAVPGKKATTGRRDASPESPRRSGKSPAGGGRTAAKSPGRGGSSPERTKAAGRTTDTDRSKKGQNPTKKPGERSRSLSPDRPRNGRGGRAGRSDEDEDADRRRLSKPVAKTEQFLK